MATKLENRRVVHRGGVRYEHPIDGTVVAEKTITVSTNGTTSVNVFGANGAPFAGKITRVMLIALDTTAGNITPKVKGNTVCTIAKGTTAGVLVGAASYTAANQTFGMGDAVTLVSSSAGNADVYITYQVSAPTDVD